MSEEEEGMVGVAYEGYLAEVYVPGVGGFKRGEPKPVPEEEEGMVGVVYEGYLAEVYVPGVGGFKRGEPKPVPEDKAKTLLSDVAYGFKRARIQACSEAEGSRARDNEGGD